MEGIKIGSNGLGREELLRKIENGHADKPVAEVDEAAEAPRHTEDMQDIISKVPNWILRWGITAFFGVLAMVVGISVLIRYPDVVKVPMQLETSAKITPVICATTGNITKVLVKKGEKVKKGQVLAMVAGEPDTTRVTPVTATTDGQIRFMAVVQPGYPVKANQQLFVVHPINEQFFGAIEIPQNNISKIKEGQQVIITLHNSADGSQQLKGRINYVADEPLKNGLFMAQVGLDNPGNQIGLKSWMTADAEIIRRMLLCLAE